MYLTGRKDMYTCGLGRLGRQLKSGACSPGTHVLYIMRRHTLLGHVHPGGYLFTKPHPIERNNFQQEDPG